MDDKAVSLKAVIETIDSFGVLDGYTDMTELKNRIMALPPVRPLFDAVVDLALLMTKPIELLNLSARSYNALTRGRIYTVAEVYKAKRNGTLNELQNLGKKSIQEIGWRLNEYLSSWEGGQDERPE